MTCLNVSSIVDTAQVVDTFFAHWVSSGAAALHFEWTNDNVSVRWMRWDYDDCSEPMLSSGECVPFFDEDGGGVLLTAGYVVTALVFLPMAVMDLKENVKRVTEDMKLAQCMLKREAKTRPGGEEGLLMKCERYNIGEDASAEDEWTLTGTGGSSSSSSSTITTSIKKESGFQVLVSRKRD